jgi:SPP1 family predicted phage head-tail adaptor
VRAGQLRHRVTLQSPVVSTNSLGEEIIASWADEATVPASIEPLSVREYFAAHQLAMATSHLVRLRARPEVKPKWRVLFGTRTFDVEGIRHVDERGIETQLLCRELTP